MNIQRERQIEAKLKWELYRSNARHIQMTGPAVRDYMLQWLQRMAPPERWEEAQRLCFPSGGYYNFLWHVFSYELAACEEGARAMAAYEATGHREFVLLMNMEQIAFVVRNGRKLPANIINKYDDIIVTDMDFQWTYVHTHESQCGPYFYAP